ncbi:hypothetical protein HYPSUDRAFT_138153 [Hypholoma sublateritium FD-334 SS-4]|uniref:Uncharacterized protein n=1 Tax=Hypholoma sublateritium (strain FD-334 SS-4) TaxID=945553 RepID=A0A0D2P2V4_HYPSF|nr:hypothetical protein HYPSUDRAFT_138153 [Hypholoma sublateritium FD-334 SS-4]
MASVAGIFINLRRLEGNTGKRILLRSGDPQTHQSVADGCRNAGTIPVEYSDQYVCQGGVNVCTLLRVTRLALLEHCNQMGANALVDEEWECRISGPKPSPNGAYKVDVVYTAGATRSTSADPRKPVHLEKAENIPGLMTIVRRKNE